MGILLFLVGAMAGIYFPDLDRRPSFLLHRSILTHNAFLPLLPALFFHRRKEPALRPPTIGLGEAPAVHLAFDLFPKDWSGYAPISWPFFGRHWRWRS